MPLAIRVTADTSKVAAQLHEIEKQIPYATALAVNDLAFQVQRAERANIASTFKHPRPFTVRSVTVDKASKASPVATVSVRPEVARYLAPYEFGGMHALPGKGLTLMEPKRVPLDQYGQLRQGTTARLKGRRGVFVGPMQTKAGRVSGFWQRLRDGHLKLLIRFGDNREVTKRLEFRAKAEALVRANWQGAFGQAIAKALASARR